MFLCHRYAKVATVCTTTMKENREGNVEIGLLVNNRISLFYNSLFEEDYRMKNNMTKSFCFAVFCVGIASSAVR